LPALTQESRGHARPDLDDSRGEVGEAPATQGPRRGADLDVDLTSCDRPGQLAEEMLDVATDAGPRTQQRSRVEGDEHKRDDLTRPSHDPDSAPGIAALSALRYLGPAPR
jgi:hypothetical protein